MRREAFAKGKVKLYVTFPRGGTTPLPRSGRQEAECVCALLYYTAAPDCRDIPPAVEFRFFELPIVKGRFV